MRWPRPRFTLRWLMIVVALAGLMAGAWGMKRRSDWYWSLANEYEFMAVFEFQTGLAIERSAELDAQSAQKQAEEAAEGKTRREFLEGSRELAGGIDPGIFIKRPASIAPTHEDFLSRSALDQARRANERLAESKVHASRADHFTRMRERYERAARHPWLTVEPDPSAPQ